MYYCTIKDNILTLISEQYSFHNTKRSFWYFDIVNWRTSITGKENSEICQDMDEASIEWCKKYYIPKAIVQNS